MLNPRCPKCGFRIVKLEFVSYEVISDDPIRRHAGFTDTKEGIVVTCNTCGFIWKTEPLDGRKEKKQ